MIGLFMAYSDPDQYAIHAFCGIFESEEKIPKKIKNKKFEDGTPAYIPNIKRYDAEELDQKVVDSYGRSFEKYYYTKPVRLNQKVKDIYGYCPY